MFALINKNSIGHTKLMFVVQIFEARKGLIDKKSQIKVHQKKDHLDQSHVRSG